jgi:hypothetical protein
MVSRFQPKPCRVLLLSRTSKPRVRSLVHQDIRQSVAIRSSGKMANWLAYFGHLAATRVLPFRIFLYQGVGDYVADAVVIDIAGAGSRVRSAD